MSKTDYEIVQLNVYLLAPEQTTSFHNMLGLAPYHSGIVFRNQEWTFSTDGVFSHKPKAIDYKHYKTLNLGKISKNLSFSDISEITSTLKKEFKGSEYHVTKKNCNHFSDAMSRALLGKGIPSWVNRVAGIGKIFTKMIPKKVEKTMMEDAKSAQILREFEKDAEKGAKESDVQLLNFLIVKNKVECLNEHPKNNVKQFLGKGRKRGFFMGKGRKILESDPDDEQMILSIEFCEKVHLIGISIGSVGPNKKKFPKIVKMYTNERSLDFENVEDLLVKKELVFDVNEVAKKEGQYHKLKLSDFRNVTTVNLWFEENFGGKSTVISDIKFWGKSVTNSGLNMNKFEEVREKSKKS